jgi:hypothetical protein
VHKEKRWEESWMWWHPSVGSALGRLRREDHLSPGVQDWPGQQRKTPFQKKKKDLRMYNSILVGKEDGGKRKYGDQGYLVQDLVGCGRDFEFYLKFSGIPLWGFNQKNDVIHLHLKKKKTTLAMCGGTGLCSPSYLGS